MPRMTKKDRAWVRLALRIAIDTEESHTDAYSSDYQSDEFGAAQPGRDSYATEQRQLSMRKIAEFRRLLVDHFGGLEDSPNFREVPLSELMRRPVSGFNPFGMK